MLRLIPLIQADFGANRQAKYDAHTLQTPGCMHQPGTEEAHFMTSEIVLIRHGETDWNTERRYQGTSDRPLNDHGNQQAKALANSMRGEEWDAIISSPLKRAMGTALPLLDALNLSDDLLIPDPRLMERSYGAAEGFTLAEREERFPGEIWEGLESYNDLETRALGTVEDYIHRFPNQRLLMVTHGTWITAVLEVLTQGEFGYGKSIILNTSRTYLTFRDGDWEVGDISIADHLGALA